LRESTLPADPTVNSEEALSTPVAIAKNGEQAFAADLTFPAISNNLRPMRPRALGLIPIAALPGLAEFQNGPPRPDRVVPNWAQLPAGWNFGEIKNGRVQKFVKSDLREDTK
jgi:hypothetical protein